MRSICSKALGSVAGIVPADIFDSRAHSGFGPIQHKFDQPTGTWVTGLFSMRKQAPEITLETSASSSLRTGNVPGDCLVEAVTSAI
jgi:hypothetical protein